MNEPVPDIDLPVLDLREWVELGLERCSHLLTAGEVLVARCILSLEGPPARLYARLTARKGSVFRLNQLETSGVPDGEDAAAALIELELADTLVPWRVRAEASTVAELKSGCRKLGLRVGGRREALVERLAAQRDWSEQAWVRIRHEALLLRLGRWATLRRWPDRGQAVVARLGMVRWPEYRVTSGPALHPDRAHLRRWEALAGGMDALTPEQLLAALEGEEHWSPGRLDLRRSLVRRVLEQARDTERQGQSTEARRLYERAVATGHVRPGTVAVRVARTYESEGEIQQAVAGLARAREQARPVVRLGISRAGRRLAKKARRRWPPDPPLQQPPRRDLRLPAAALEGPRPGYRTDEGAAPVEAAVQQLLSAQGRTALHVEGGLWRELFVLLFVDTWFAPIAGALPTRFLSGPLDLGTPTFAERRRDAVDAVLAGVERGEASDRVVEADARWRGTRLRGMRWQLPADALQTAAAAIPARALAAVMRTFLTLGWRASRGLPDLVVLPGEPARLPGALPSRVGPDLLLAEVKGPGDTVRDEQSVWFDRLLRAGAAVELWSVTRVGQES